MADGQGDPPLPSATPLRERLPRLAPGEVRVRNAWLAALTAGGLQARLEDKACRGPALRFAGGVWAQPDRIGGAPAAWISAPHAPELPEALVAFSTLEPLLAAVERATGQALAPVGLERAPDAGLRLTVALGDAHAVGLLVEADARAPSPRSPKTLSPGPWAHAPVVAKLTLGGPQAPAAELGLLARGDLVPALAGPNGIEAWLSAPGAGLVRGRFRPGPARLTCEDVMSDGDVDADAAAGGGALPDGLKVRLRLELGEVETTLGALASLAPGSVLPVTLAGDAPEVTLTAHGRVLARGRLVALGDGYGMIVDALEAQASPAAA